MVARVQGGSFIGEDLEFERVSLSYDVKLEEGLEP